MTHQAKKSKTNLNQVDPDFIEKLAEIFDYGDKKYNNKSWKEYKDINLLASALLRHIDKFRIGELIDKESGLEHLMHAGANIMMLHYLIKNKILDVVDLNYCKKRQAIIDEISEK